MKGRTFDFDTNQTKSQRKKIPKRQSFHQDTGLDRGN